MGRLRVFIVDDDRDFAESLAMLIEGRNCEVELAFSGEEAIAVFQEEDAGTRQFDLVLMDVRLPGMNGVESLLEIHRLRPSTRVVMMTGYSVEQLLEKAVEQGAWGVLRKPSDIHKVLPMLDSLKPDGILIVDDDPDFVDSMKALLQGQGYMVFIARDGQEALDRIRSNGVDILILDLCLPILSGLETYLELKRTGHVLPTIIVTAYAEECAGDIDQLRLLEVSGVLRKPFDPEELLGEVERLSLQRKE